MNTKELKRYEDILIAEKKELEGELAEIAQTNPQNRAGWEATAKAFDIDSADENEVADKFEELEGNEGIASQLENQLIDVKSALDKVAKGTYGICEKCGKAIEKERLDANPSARVSLKHAHK